MRTRGAWLALAGLAVWAAGCGGSGGRVHPVSGRVNYKGKPAGGALVYFHMKGKTNPSQPMPYGKTESDGTFRLTTFNPNDGAPEGDYDVSIYWPAEVSSKSKESQQPSDGSRDSPPDKLNGRYLKPGPGSPTAVVKAGNNDLPAFDLQ